MMSFSPPRLSAAALCSAVVLSGCANVAGPHVGGNVQYGDARAVETVTNEFGSTDLQTIAESMTRSLLQSRAITGARETPIVALAEVKNKTSEYIDTRAITEKIRVQLTKSGAVKFAVSTNEMQNQLDELTRQNQTGLYKNKGKARIGQMQGSRYRLEGSISSIVKRSSSTKDVFYLFNLSLVDNESGLLEWADEKEIRKTSAR
ncbi:penicillin-binding protein activator LpoB [Imbroritus primus]|uniref:Penicillin-binding protein activator LpoB n=1 Tax=Imbroritus primus TaxID=3058603 RepID=A0ACD3SSF4_9BURK|nr:penicillin-binding protein activator LpoB [Burkholderiaceae bacterium PBA]